MVVSEVKEILNSSNFKWATRFMGAIIVIGVTGYMVEKYFSTRVLIQSFELNKYALAQAKQDNPNLIKT